MIFVWKFQIKPLGGIWNIYELLPAFLAALAAIVIVSLATPEPMICDGAKASCAGKIAAAIDAGVLGYRMYQNGQQFYGGDGILSPGLLMNGDQIGQHQRPVDFLLAGAGLPAIDDHPANSSTAGTASSPTGWKRPWTTWAGWAKSECGPRIRKFYRLCCKLKRQKGPPR